MVPGVTCAWNMPCAATPGLCVGHSRGRLRFRCSPRSEGRRHCFARERGPLLREARGRHGDWSVSHSALGMTNKCKRIAETLHNLTDSVYIASGGLKSVSAMGSGASVYPGIWEDTLPCLL